jgi:tetratricopeptide (TPR) repeat protein
MGVVYRAVDEKLGRPVALKFLSADRGDEQARARFAREARAASALDHPNIGTVYEIGEADGAPFIVMALYQGETLRARLDRAPIPAAEIVSIAKQLAAALGAAHAAGIIHRDLKPANVMLLGDGTVKLLDFGLAKLTSVDESSLTREGSLLGTLAYMAPEQLKGATVDARTDLWALGAVLHEMLSGKPPFSGGGAATVVTSILHQEPAPLPANAPHHLAAITRSLLRKDRDDRLDSAERIGALLASGSSPGFSLPQRRRRAFFVALPLAALVPLVIYVVIPKLRPPPPPPTPRERAANLAAQYEHGGPPSLLFDAAEAYFDLGDPSRARELYRSYLERVPDAPNGGHVRERLAVLSIDAEVREPSPASAAQGRQQLEEARRKRDVGKFEEAASLFASGYELTRDRSALLEAAQANESAGQKRLALMYYDTYRQQASATELEAIASHVEALRQELGPPTKSSEKEQMKQLAAQHYKVGMAKFDRGDFDGAAVELDAAYAAYANPSILFNTGQSFRLAGQYGHSLDAYSRFLQTSPEPTLRAEVEKYVREMRDAIDAKGRRR